MAQPAEPRRACLTTANTASSWIDGKGEEQTMQSEDHRALPDSRPTLVAARTIAVAVLAMACGGCIVSSKLETTASVPNDYRHRHPIAIKEAERTLEVFVGTRRAGLTPVQRGDVYGFAGDWRREATGGVIIDVPAGTPNARAAADATRDIRAILTGAGVPSHVIETRGYRPRDPSLLATVRLNYPKMRAEAGPCGLWPDDLGPTLNPGYNNNEPYWNLGCANQRNVAAMVANPEDLVQPRAETAIYAPRRSIALDKYRKGESTATNYPDPSKGTISDIGK
jgi:pilus assembly protein CpaD